MESVLILKKTLLFDDDDNEPVQVNNGNYNIVNDDSDGNDNDEENLLENEFNEELEATPEITLKSKVIKAMKNSQLSLLWVTYNHWTKITNKVKKYH